MSQKTITVTIYTCRCGHEWQPRRKRKPKVCPRCKRTNWDKKP